MLNGDRTPEERIDLVIVNTGDRPVQIGSHIHLPDVNPALDFDRVAATGLPAGHPVRHLAPLRAGRLPPVQAVAFRGRRLVPGIQLRTVGDV